MSELFSGHGWKIILDSAKLPDGRIKKVGRASKSDIVHVLAFRDDGKLLLLREYRPYWGAWIWMLPSGHVDKETSIEIAAQRELQEETGFQASELSYFCSANHSESLMNTNHFFIGRKLSPAPLKKDDDEFIEVHAVDLDEAIQKVFSSEKVHMASTYGLLRYQYDKSR